MTHAWSLDPAGQAVIRRAEDGRTDAVPTLAELFAAVPWMIPKSVSGSSCARVDDVTSRKPAVRMLPSQAEPWKHVPADLSSWCEKAKAEKPHGWLTAEEREALRWAVSEAEGRAKQWTVGDQIGLGEGDRVAWHADSLIGLLARETPPRVRKPKVKLGGFPKDLDDVWIAAIREAGGEVVE